MKICFHFQNLANPTRIPTNYSPFSPLPETSTPRFTSDYLTCFTLYQTPSKSIPPTLSPKLPFTLTPIPLPTPLPTSYPTSTPYSSFPFLPFPSLETGAYHVYQTVDPRDFPRTFKLTLTHSLAHRIKRTLSNRYQTIELSAALIDPHRLSSTREHQTHQKRTRNQKEKYGTSPFDCYSSSCISNCVFTNKLGEVAEDIWPGARPVLSFPLSFPHPPLFPTPTVLDSPYSPTCSLSTMIYVMNSRTLDLTLPPRYCYC